MESIGLIGVGQIGAQFLEALESADRSAVAFDIDSDRMAVATELGARTADSPTAVARETDSVILALPGTPAVEAVFRDDEFLDALDGGLIIDATTTHPETGIVCEERATGANVEYVAAPLTQAAPREGVFMLIGATESAYDRATPLLDLLGDEHRRIGPVGDGRRLKLALQLRYALRTGVDAEVVAFCREASVDPGLLHDFLGMDISERLLQREYGTDNPGLGALGIWHKDLGYALDVARENDVPLPLTSTGHELYKAGRRLAGPEENSAEAVMHYWERLHGEQ